MNHNTVEIDDQKKNITENDVKKIVLLHMKYLSVGLLPSLGKDFLIKLYMHIIQNPCCFLALARHKDSREIFGFCAGTSNSSFFYKEFIKENIFFILFNLPLKICRNFFILFPRVLHVFIFEIMKFFIKEKKISIQAQLLSIVLDDTHQSLGLGSILFDKMRVFMLEKGQEKFFAIASETQKEAQIFYKKNEGHIEKTVNIGFLHSNKYIFNSKKWGLNDG